MEKLLNNNKNEAIENDLEMEQLSQYVGTLSDKNLIIWLQNNSSNINFDNNLNLIISALPSNRWEKIKEKLVDCVRVY